MFRRTANGLELLCVHPGGPYFQHRDAGAWSIPKGVPEPDEALFRAACREFTEETGLSSTPPYLPLGEVRQKGGKVVHAWAFEGDTPPGWQPTSNTFELEWPPQSGRQQRFPEIDRAAWLDPVAGFVIAAFAIHEGREAWEGELVEDDDYDE